MTVLDADGTAPAGAAVRRLPEPDQRCRCFTAPLSTLAQYGYMPQPGYAQLGANAILGGIVSQPAEEVDFNIVDAVRNDLVRINADLFSFNVARGRDVGLGTLNQVRAGLAPRTAPMSARRSALPATCRPIPPGRTSRPATACATR